jgi:hypothetical protein
MVQKVEQLIAEHNDKVFRLNEDIRKNDRIQKVVTKKSDNSLQEMFYKYAEDTAQKLSKILLMV